MKKTKNKIIKNNKPNIIKSKKNNDISIVKVIVELIALFLFSTLFFFFTIGLLRTNFTVSPLDYKEGIIVALIVFTLFLLILFVLVLIGVLKNKNKVDIIASFLKESIIPITALSLVFLGRERILKIEKAIQINEIINNKDFFILFLGSALLIVPPVLTIIFNSVTLYNKIKKKEL